MNTVSTLSDFLKRSDFDFAVDEDTLLIAMMSGEARIVTLRKLDTSDGKGLDYNINLDCPWKGRHDVQIHPSYTIISCEYGVLVTRHGRLVVIIPVYECGYPKIHNDMILVTGHEQAFVIRLDDMTKSMGMNTR